MTELKEGDIVKKKLGGDEKYVIIEIHKGVMSKIANIADNARTNLGMGDGTKLGDLICKRETDGAIGRLFSSEVIKVQ